MLCIFQLLRCIALPGISNCNTLIVLGKSCAEPIFDDLDIEVFTILNKKGAGQAPSIKAPIKEPLSSTRSDKLTALSSSIYSPEKTQVAITDLTGKYHQSNVSQIDSVPLSHGWSDTCNSTEIASPLAALWTKVPLQLKLI